jgi:hypothetical protein
MDFYTTKMVTVKDLFPIVEVRNQDYRFKNLFYNSTVEPKEGDLLKEEFFIFHENGFRRVPWNYDINLGYFAELRDEITNSNIQLTFDEWVYNFGRNLDINKKYLFENSPFSNLLLLQQIDNVKTIEYVIEKVNSIIELLKTIPNEISKIPQKEMDLEYLRNTIDSCFHRLRVFRRVFLQEPSNDVFCL